MAKPDMSPQAISARLRRVSELRRVCIALGKATPARTASTPRGGNIRGEAKHSRPEKTSSGERNAKNSR